MRAAQARCRVERREARFERHCRPDTHWHADRGRGAAALATGRFAGGRSVASEAHCTRVAMDDWRNTAHC